MLKKLKSFLFENATISQTIAKNTFWLVLGALASRLFRAAIVIYAARVLGAERWGAFSYALGIITFLTAFSDIGINALLTRESAKDGELKNQYLSTAFFTKLGLLFVIAAAIIIAFPYLTKIEEAAAIMPILIFVFAFDTLRDLGSALARALQKMQIEAVVSIFTNFAIAALGFILLTRYGGTASLAIAYAAGSGLGLIAIFYALRGHYQNIFGNFRRKLVKPIFATAWPFGLFGLMGVINLNTDIIMLGWLRSAEEVGFYGASQKIIQLLYVLPALLAASVFPVISKAVKSSPESAKKLLEKTAALSLIAALPITLIGVIFGTQIISMFGAEYAPAVLAFKILMLTVLIVYPSVIIGHAVFAYDEQKHFLKYVLVSSLGNVALNLLLIPPLGIEGAAVATVITQTLTNFLIWRRMKRVNNFKILPQVKNFILFKKQ